MIAHAQEANSGVSHDEFVEGVKSGRIGFRCVVGEPSKLLRGWQAAVFASWVVIYSVAPLLLIPLWAWHEGNWWLLLGIVVSWLGLQSRSIAPLLLIWVIGSWIRAGIHSYFTFFPLCALSSSLLFQIAEETQKSFALDALVEDAGLFYEAAGSGTIEIVRKD